MDEEIKDKLDRILSVLKRIYNGDVWFIYAIILALSCISGCFSCHYTESTRGELRETNKHLEVIIHKLDSLKQK
jgi:hypothetical protein